MTYALGNRWWEVVAACGDSLTALTGNSRSSRRFDEVFSCFSSCFSCSSPIPTTNSSHFGPHRLQISPFQGLFEGHVYCSPHSRGYGSPPALDCLSSVPELESYLPLASRLTLKKS